MHERVRNIVPPTPPTSSLESQHSISDKRSPLLEVVPTKADQTADHNA